MPKKQLILFSLFFFLLTLDHFQIRAMAEQVNNSVKECYENPAACEGQKEMKEEQTTNSIDHDKKSVGLTLWDFVQMIFATIFVVALLYFVLKFVSKKNQLFKSSQIMENLGGVSLGTNRSVQMVKVGDRLLIVGVGENVQLIKEIESGSEMEQILAQYNDKLDHLMQPNDLLGKIHKKIKEARSRDTKETSLSFQGILKKQLEDLSKDRKRIYEEVGKSEGKDSK